MKKVLIMMAVVLGLTFAANAQDRAIGIHGGFGWELSYQQPLSLGFFTTLDADLGLYLHSFVASATVNKYFPLADVENLTWFVGPGLRAHFYSGGVSLGVVGRIGLQYSFSEVPLNISIDWKPIIGIQLADGTLNPDYGCYYGGIGIRYRF